MSSGVGVPGGKHRRSPGDRARASAYRHSTNGMQARKMYLMQPEVKAHMALRRKAKLHAKGLA